MSTDEDRADDQPSSGSPEGPILGLCCQFSEHPIRFRTTTWSVLSKLAPAERQAKLAGIADDNLTALSDAVDTCVQLGIGAFRIGSNLMPLATHPGTRADWDVILADTARRARGDQVREAAQAAGVRLSFHPDQYIVLNSLRPDVVDAAIRDLDAQAVLAAWLGADTITLHGGGGVGGVDAAVERLAAGVARLSEEARRRLAIENDDRTFTPDALLPWCLEAGVPFVYDVHHHRCLPDGHDVATITELALASWASDEWARRPYFHISSPRASWGMGDPRPHHDTINPTDWPAEWNGLAITVDVEAKAKEPAVLALSRALESGR